MEKRLRYVPHDEQKYRFTGIPLPVREDIRRIDLIAKISRRKEPYTPV
jgi:hypothetical protein